MTFPGCKQTKQKDEVTLLESAHIRLRLLDDILELARPSQLGKQARAKPILALWHGAPYVLGLPSI